MPRRIKKPYFVYILKCRDGSYYTGYTSNLARRVEEHNSGRGGRYTRGRFPVELVHAERYPTRKEAINRELEIKKFSRKAKNELIKGYDCAQVNK